MSKVLKIVGVFASVAAAAVTAGVSLGISAALLSGIGVAASVGASLLAPKVKNAPGSKENIDRLRASIDTRAPRKTVVGRTAMNTDIRDEEFTGGQDFFHRFLVVAAHKVRAISEIWFDDKLAWSLASGVQGEFVGYLTVTPVLEGNAGNAINISGRMGSSRRYTGLAYAHLRYKLTGNSKKTESPFASSITTRITVRGDGAYLYDPRFDSTVPGGSGPQRANDQNTWVWSDDGCRNPALAALFYLLGWRINGRLSVGKGIPANRIDLESFAVAANICDEPVAKEGGGTEPRYRCDGTWSEGDAPATVLDSIKAAMNADLDDVNGKYRLSIFYNDLALPVASFTDDDVLDEFDWSGGPPLEESFNIIRGTYTDPRDVSLYQQLDYPPIEDASPDGIDRIDTFSLPLVQSPSQAQRLAGLRHNRRKFGGGTFTANLGPRGWACEKNSIVQLSFRPRGFVNKLFRVASMEYRDNGVVPVILREESAAIYGPPALQAPVDPVASTPFDYTLSPLNQALTRGAFRVVSRSVPFPLSTDDDTVTVAAFSGVLDDSRTIEFAAADIAAAPGTTYAVLFDLSALTYSVAAQPATLELANANNVFLGWAVTSDGGEYPAPPTPPPGYGGEGGFGQYTQPEVSPRLIRAPP